MGPIDLLIHLSNFMAPALCLAVLAMLGGKLFVEKGALVPRWWTQVATNFIAGLVVLIACLWFFGRDGKMASYAALVVVSAFSQWLLLRGWRK